MECWLDNIYMPSLIAIKMHQRSSRDQIHRVRVPSLMPLIFEQVSELRQA